MKYVLFRFSMFLFILFGCSPNTAYEEALKDPNLFHANMRNLTEIIVYDIFSPPVASRIYFYPTIASYQILTHNKEYRLTPLKGKLKELKSQPQPIDKNVNLELSALYAFNTVGKELIFSVDKMNEYEKELEEQIKQTGVPLSVRKASKKYAKKVADNVLKWANQDFYKETRTYPKHSVLQADQYWKPTPPDYMQGIEPHWNKIRPLVLDSANQFEPKPPLKFDLIKGSLFQNQLYQVYTVGKLLTEEQIEIAKFWDCNPYVTHHKGHAMFATKKITPGGHWIGITSIASKKSMSNFASTVNAYAKVSIAIFDAFISCWDEKWNSLVVRPETLINKYYDEDWIPLLQTPPFPEYTSGHSVISNAAAVILTDIFGQNFSFEDSTEVAYGLPIRKFNSFMHAAEEAAISRLYGGIHYMMAIEEGVVQGKNIGNYISEKLDLKQ